MKNTKTQITALMYRDRIGQYAVNESGKIITKCAALIAELEGRTVTWKTKPGWKDGQLINVNEYEEYLLKRRF